MLKEAEKKGNKIQEQNPKINPNKAGFFESSFSVGGVNFTPSSYFKKN